MIKKKLFNYKISSCLTGLFGRYLGCKGSAIITTICLFFKKWNTKKFISKIPHICIIGLLIIGLLIIFYNLEFQKNDFYGRVKIIFLITFLILLIMTICLNVLMVLKNFDSINLSKNVKELIYILKLEVTSLKFSYKFVFFGLVFFVIFLLLVKCSYIKLAFVLLLFGIIFVINKCPSIRSLNNQLKSDNALIDNIYKKNYKFIYYFSKFIKIIFFIYVPYFFIWCLIAKSYNWNELIYSLEYFQTIMNELSQAGQNLYILYCLFLNSLILDSFMESFVIYSQYTEQPVMVVRFIYSLGRNISKAASLALGGGVVVGGTVAYSPLVEIPGVNEFQVNYGRGYGYRTSLDYLSGTIYNRYLTKSQFEELIQKHGGQNKVLDGIFFKLLSEDKDIIDIMHKNATVNELRYLGLRKF